ncbi:MAG: excinuclease ABC subunit UvrA [Candidatus Stahlbacteria bacterium]|nr:excinuclease ABC subunit UvrA [Candidatus Stahlbacteria bacterium]
MCTLIIKGARVHNLKNIDVEIPKDKFVVITGLSGSGKSSLAFDTIYAEGQRRYVESLSAYARQFLGLMKKPDIDYIEGLSPAISIGQRKPSKNPRSTVGTVTEIYDYLRLLFARIGVPHCYKCGKKISPQTIDQIVDRILDLPSETKVQILAPIIRGRKGEYHELFNKIKRKGFVRIRVNSKNYDVDTPPTLDRYKKHNIEIVVDRLVIKAGIRSRLADSCETALREAEGILFVESSNVKIQSSNQIQMLKLKVQNLNTRTQAHKGTRAQGHKGNKVHIFSTKLACPTCDISYEEISPRMFSFNTPYGACKECGGLGTELDIDPELIISHSSLSVAQGAIEPWGEISGWLKSELSRLMARHKIKEAVLNKPYETLDEQSKSLILYGDEYFDGVIPFMLRKYKSTESDAVRWEIEKYMVVSDCPACKGARLKPESLAMKIRDKNIHHLTQLSIKESLDFFDTLNLTEQEYKIAKEIIKEIQRRLSFLLNVGLDYITLARNSDTLSGGEDERVRLATQIGSGLVGVIYILDEPTVGLHQRDTQRLVDTLKHLRDIGNTVIVVEHDKSTILQADWVLDLGPGGGEYGGKVVAAGTPQEIMKNNASLTGTYLSGERKVEIPKTRRLSDKSLVIKGAKHNNLKSVDVSIPLRTFTVVTGVSGSGKSSLINDTLYRALARHFWHSKRPPGEYEALLNLNAIDKVINIDQSPIGRTPRSNPVTYTGVFTYIRELFAELKESKARGYKMGRFSFNVSGGRCEACQGDGLIKVEMHFLPDIYIECEACKGKRFNRETLEITYKDKNIAEVLEMTVTEAIEHFNNIPKIARKLSLLRDCGLGYIRLGQPATYLSGGEAQRIKLAKELSKIATGNTLYLLDEPTTGLHFEDVKLLLIVLNRLVDKGNTVLVIEHNPEVIKCADWIIDLGPEGGEQGGKVVVQGTPEKVAKCKYSHTGKVLKTF